jgi:hypothetical protein
MVELGSHATTERTAMVTFRLTVSRARILSRHPHATFRGSCALKVHEIQSPEMATAAKLSSQPGTESCVVSGNEHHEA